MNLVFMGVLVFFIRNTVRMTAVIAEQNATLELRVAERTAQLSQKTNDINAMLNNMSLGVYRGARQQARIRNTRLYMKTIFETDDLAGKDVLEVLFANSTLGVDSKGSGRGCAGSDCRRRRNDVRLQQSPAGRRNAASGRDGHNKILQMNWSPIKNDADMVDKVLLIVRDVTHLRELELAAAHQKEELT